MNEEQKIIQTEKKQRPKGRIIFFIFVSVFCLLLVFFAVYGIAVPDRYFSENENRVLEQKPVLTWQGIVDGSFMKKTESYLSDQFPFRDEAIYIKSLMERMLGKNEENGAYIGKDGFLFSRQSSYDEEKMNGLAAEISDFCKANPQLNAVFALVPNSSFVYSEKLPENLVLESQSEQILKFYLALGEKVKAVDTVTALLDEKETSQIFYRTDHHWTTSGAFSVFEKTMECFDVKTDKDDFEFHTVSNSFEGTLKAKSRAQTAVDSVDVCFPKDSQGTFFLEFSGDTEKRSSFFFEEKLDEKNKYEVFLGGNYGKVTVKTTLEGDRKLLVIKDSFANCMLPMFTPYFSKIVILDPRYMTESVSAVMQEDDFTDLLFVYNVNTLLEDSSLATVLATKNYEEEKKNEED